MVHQAEVQKISGGRGASGTVSAQIQSGVEAHELERHRSQLMKFALLRLRNVAAAEDAVQETLLAALRSVEGFARQSSVKTWLIGILKHKIVDTIRRQSREVSLDLNEESSAEESVSRYSEDMLYQEAAPEWSEPDASLTQRRFFEMLERLLTELPKKTARVFKMREVIGLETEEICQTLGITPSNCWVMLHRARAALRVGLEQQWFGAETAETAGIAS
jgi:RNA polymerase sigma-70 factor (ECF subfamily)